MSKFTDLTGNKYGRLKVICRAKDILRGNRPRTAFECKCDCGTVKIIDAGDLKSGRINSCGCLKSEITSKRMGTHRLTKTRLHNIWTGMKTRCNNENQTSFERYGKRGIKVCEDWENFSDFYNWAVYNGYADNLTIDRIDNDKGYIPENCRWTNYTTQSRNQKIRKNNKTGIKGVSQIGQKYMAYIHINGRQLKLGRFDTLEKASEARKQAEVKYWDKDAD